MPADCTEDQIGNSPPPGARVSRRELQSLLRAMARVPPGAAVLNIPCGVGRCLDVFARRGDRVTCVDLSQAALDCASRRWRQLVEAGSARGSEPQFVLGRLLATGFPPRHFDAVVCTGFFDRLGSSDFRIEALHELRRVSRGPVIVSFCNAFALGALRFTSRRSAPSFGSRVPVPVWALLNDLRRAGLQPVERHAVLWGLSPLWHIVSVPSASHAGSFRNAPHADVARAA
jgi:SAM-dependent methyltransferase